MGLNYAYYKFKDRADKRLKLEQQIIEIVHKRRRSLPRDGVRKLKVSLDNEFTKANLKVGRDTLFNVLRKHQMLTLRKKYSSRTTNSYHRFYKYNNIIKDLEVTMPAVLIFDSAGTLDKNNLFKPSIK